MHPFLYRFMPSPAAGTPRNLGGGKNTQSVSIVEGSHEASYFSAF